MATLATIRTAVRQNVATSLTDSQINDFINEANEELAMLYGLRGSETVTLASGTQEYALAATFRRHVWVKVSNKMLGYITPDRLARLGSLIGGSGTATDFYIRPADQTGGVAKIGFVPIPNGTGSATVEEVIAATALSADADVSKLPAVYHRYLTFYGSAMVAEAEGQQDVANRFTERYEAGKKQLILDAATRDYGTDVANLVAQRQG